MTGQETRNKLTDYWKDHEIKEGEEYAILTNIIHQEWADVSVKELKLNVPIAGGDGIYSNDFITIAGTASEGDFGTTIGLLL